MDDKTWEELIDKVKTLGNQCFILEQERIKQLNIASNEWPLDMVFPIPGDCF
mgnify:CR=1 FL=1